MKKAITYLSLSFIFLIGCVQKEHDKKVTFVVDTKGLENIKTIGIRGDFLPNQWNETVFLKDDNNDGIFQLTFKEKTAVNAINFKFVKNTNDFELKGLENRKLELNYKSEKITYKTTFNTTTSEIIRN